MDPELKIAICRAVGKEPFAKALNLNLIELELGRSVVEMTYRPDLMNNIYARAHGGALFALIDEAFETAAQTHGVIAVALNVNVTYIRAPEAGETLRAEACESSLTRKTANYTIKVINPKGQLVATCQALAYRTGKPVTFNEPK